MGSYWLPMFLWFVKHSPGPDHILHWFLWLMLHQKNGSILPVKIEQFLMTHLISYKMNHIYIVYICIWLLLWCIYIFTIIVIAHVLLGSKNVCFAFCGSQATSMALRCWKCPQLGPSCTPSPFETRDQLVEKTGVLHLLRTPPVLMGEYGDSAKIVISWDFIGQVGLVH